MQIRHDSAVSGNVPAPPRQIGRNAGFRPAEAVRTSPAATPPPAVGPAGASLLVLQEHGGQELPQPEATHTMLQRLEGLRDALLRGVAPHDAAVALDRALAEGAGAATAGDTALAELRVRAAVELAKLERTAGVDRQV